MTKVSVAVLNAVALCLGVMTQPVVANDQPKPEMRVLAEPGDPVVISVDELPGGPLDLETLTLRFRNVSQEPVHYVRVVMGFPEAKHSSGLPWGFPVTFGRSGLLLGREAPGADDQPILPGESIQLSIPAETRRATERYFLNRDGELPKITCAVVYLTNVTFTGQKTFATTGHRIEAARKAGLLQAPIHEGSLSRGH